MFASEVAAREAYNQARQKMERALVEFAEAEKNLRALGKPSDGFTAVDKKARLEFATKDGTTHAAEMILTDY